MNERRVAEHPRPLPPPALGQQGREAGEVTDVVHAKSPGTTATTPMSAAGSATAWSIAIFSSVGQISSNREGSAAMARNPAASSGCHRPKRSSSVAARTTNMPAFQRNSPVERYAAARRASGFSTNWRTRRAVAPRRARRPIWM